MSSIKKNILIVIVFLLDKGHFITGFGYRSLREDIDISLMDSIILAYWSCSQSKEKRKQKISY